MAKQATLTTLTSVNNNIATLNANFTALNTALLNTFSLDGSTPNALNGDLDLNSNDLLNGGSGAFASLTIAGQTVAPSELVIAGSLLVDNNLSDLDDAAAARANLGLEIGTDVQAYDSNLPTWPADVDSTEVGYLSGVTSDIQTQLNAKASSSHTHSHTDITDYDTELAGKTNTTAFTPSADYHPATKKYVDDSIIPSPSGWQPYNGTDGIFWEQSVDGSSVSEETPSFEDGYEYMILLDDISRSLSGAHLELELYRDTLTTWSPGFEIGGDSSFESGTNPHTGYCQLILPRYSTTAHIAQCHHERSDSGAPIDLKSRGKLIKHGSADTIGKARITISSGLMNDGRLILLRRAEGLT